MMKSVSREMLGGDVRNLIFCRDWKNLNSSGVDMIPNEMVIDFDMLCASVKYWIISKCNSRGTITV
ncbi:hypothetical protein MA16_Dca016684 [Dendrobium catenatum]|uniref:Uncharacterized protein n=1 Tax=Dendrobium catenatum TaxID=906689 RepID=A0A2I0XHW2_9ASPA|nr:hypothetical protein MA16_Dca016684 [Dendrobium catenatum]